MLGSARIWLAYSTNNRISGNNITANKHIGIDIDASSNNTLSGNNVTANNGDGIVLETCSNNNSICGNKITDNNGTGMRLARASVVNGTEVTFRPLSFSNETYSYLHFNYTHSTQEVIVMPESP